MTSKPKLGYWDIRAICEPIRFLLNYLEIDFEDYRIPLGEGESAMVPWTSQKYSHGLDLPNLPFYIDGDVKLTQSLAILQYIGEKYNLCGDNLEEKATACMVAQALNDLRWQSWLAYNANDFHEIKEDWKQTIPGRFSEINRFMKGNCIVIF
jgi:glutathione S-transferase